MSQTAADPFPSPQVVAGIKYELHLLADATVCSTASPYAEARSCPLATDGGGVALEATVVAVPWKLQHPYDVTIKSSAPLQA
jgi:hypothetical protein